MIDEIKELGTNVKNMQTRQDDIEKSALLNQNALDQLLTLHKSGMSGAYQTKTLPGLIYEQLGEQEDNIKKLAKKDIKNFSFDLKAVGDMSFGVNLTNAAGSVAYVKPGVVGAAARPWHVRDLIPTGPMTGSNFIYLKETGIDGGIATATEGSTKSQIDFLLTEVSTPAQVIAGWLRISKQMLEDIPSMQLFLSNRLLECLLVVEDTQLMGGNGTPPNLLGINSTGNFTAASGAATLDGEQLVQAIAQLAALSRQPSGIVLNPTDYFNIMLNKAATSGDYTQPPIVKITDDGTMRIAGCPVIWTIAQAAGTFTVGDFSNGSVLLFRDSPRIEFYLEDGTNVRENKITIRVEERVAFAVFGSTYFIKGTF